MRPSPSGRAAARALICSLSIVAALALVAPAQAVAVRQGRTTVSRLLDVPPGHPWRKDTRLALAIAKALPGRTPEQAHRLAVRYLVRSSPRTVRQYVHVGDVRGDRFTVTYVGDQACAVWRSGRGPHFAMPGPCTPADRMRLHNPLVATARVVGFLIDRSIGDASTHRERVRLVRSTFERATLANISWQYAPRGVGVAGLIDQDQDGRDDDARVTLHAQGRALCVRFGVYPGQRSTWAWGQCRNLEPRVIHYPAPPR